MPYGLTYCKLTHEAIGHSDTPDGLCLCPTPRQCCMIDTDTGEQHDEHRRAWLDFWCGQLDRKVRHYERQDERSKADEAQKDGDDEASGIAR